LQPDRSVKKTLSRLQRRTFVAALTIFGCGFFILSVGLTFAQEHRRMRSIVTSNLSYIKYLITIGSQIDLERHLALLGQTEGMLSLYIEDASGTYVAGSRPQEDLFTVATIADSLMFFTDGQLGRTPAIRWVYRVSLDGMLLFALTGLLLAVLLSRILAWNAKSVSEEFIQPFYEIENAFEEIKNKTQIEHRFTSSWIESQALLKQFSELLAALKGHEELKVKYAMEQERIFIAKKVSHDIRSPLSALRIGISKLKNSESADLLLAAANRIDKIALDLLNDSIGTVIKGHHSGQEILCEIENVVDEKIAFCESENRNIEIEFEAGGLPPKGFFPTAASDFGRLASNLISNSIEAFQSDLRARILVELKFEADCLKLSVSDNGPGIPTEIREKIFENGFSTKDKKSGSGFGLGLSGAREYLEQYQGSIQVESFVGVGSKFRVSVPTVKA
jgi:signal transduction histidine kinase